MPNITDIRNEHRTKIFKAYEKYARKELVDSNSVVLQSITLRIFYHHYANKRCRLKKLMWSSGLVVWRNFCTQYSPTAFTDFIPYMPYRRFSQVLPEGQEVHVLDKNPCMNTKYSMADYAGYGCLPLAVGMGGHCYDEFVVAIGWDTFKEMALLITEIRTDAAKKRAERKYLKDTRKDMSMGQWMIDIITPNKKDYNTIVDVRDHGMALFPEFVEELIDSAVQDSQISKEDGIN